MALILPFQAMIFRNRFTLLPALLMLAFLPPEAAAFSSSNLQLLHGTHYRDRYLGNNTVDGRMTTLTVEHFSTWSLGDNYFFVDLLQGRFNDFTGNPTHKNSRIYAEWNPRLSLSALSGRKMGAGIVTDVLLAGQLNRDGEGFRANLIGMAADLALPGFAIASVHGYVRKDNFNRTTWQNTLVWDMPLPAGLSLSGFADIYGSDNNGTEIITQPQLLLDLSSLVESLPPGLYTGIEWDFHRNRHLTSSVPQAMMKWSW